MPESFEILPYQPDFRDDVLRLQRHLWGSNLDVNAAYFSWKYERNPFSSDPTIFLALNKNRIVGMRGMMAARWSSSHDRGGHSCFCACDLVVSPEYRRRGLFLKIMQHAVREIRNHGQACLLNFSASPITYLASVKSGWHAIDRYRTFRWQKRTKSLANTLRGQFKRTPYMWRFAEQPIPILERRRCRLFEKLGNSVCKNDQTDLGVLTLNTSLSNELMQIMIDFKRDSARQLQHAVSAEYLHWRYQNPMSKYAFLVLTSGTRSLGYLTLRISTEHPSDMSIVDWEAADAGALRAMLGSVVNSKVVDSLSIWSATLSRTELNSLEELGFQRVDESRGIVGFSPGPLVRGLENESRSVELAGRHAADPGAWKLRMVYSDLY